VETKDTKKPSHDRWKHAWCGWLKENTFRFIALFSLLWERKAAAKITGGQSRVNARDTAGRGGEKIVTKDSRSRNSAKIIRNQAVHEKGTWKI